MMTYIRLYTDFFRHRKTLKLKASIGESAMFVMPRLWAYAAESQPDGLFKGYSPEAIRDISGFSGDPALLVSALLECGYLDSKTMQLHEFELHNGFHLLAKARAKAAAEARWGRYNAQAMHKQCKSHAQAMLGKERKGKESKGTTTKETTTALAPSPENPGSGAVQIPEKIYFSFKTNNWHNITDENRRVWAEAYPACNIESELAKAKAWLIANPKKKKSDYRKFLNGWLNRCQDSGGTRGAAPSATSAGGPISPETMMRLFKWCREQKWDLTDRKFLLERYRPDQVDQIMREAAVWNVAGVEKK
jgi:hypothetical protein